MFAAIKVLIDGYGFTDNSKGSMNSINDKDNIRKRPIN